jgi:hypothetical protein
MIEPDSVGVYGLCPANKLEIIARQGECVQVRVTDPGQIDACTRVLALPAKGTEGWLRDADVFAP